MEIVDNVLSEKTFNNIVNYTCNNNDFPWNLVQNGVSVPGDGKYPVSYTHLTLPTIYSV